MSLDFSSPYFQEVLAIEKEYFKIIEKFDNSFIVPLNLQEEREMFFQEYKKGNIYNPQFIFPKRKLNQNIPEKLTILLRTINLKADKFGLKKLYAQRIEAKINEFYSHKYWGTQKSGFYVEKYRGRPKNHLMLLKAKYFCRTYKRQTIRFTKISLDHLGDQLKNFVFELTGDNIDVVQMSLNNKMNISAPHHLIRINKYERFTSLDLERLKVHEIGTHYLRYYNGAQSGFRILESGTANYIETEEGLATYMEELAGVSSKAQMFIYAGRYIAAYYTNSKSFYEIFELLVSYGFKKRDAFIISQRVKRNLCDTSEKGGFVKDYVYYSGYHKIKKYAKKSDLKNLYLGKVTIEDLKNLKFLLKERKEKLVTLFE